MPTEPVGSLTVQNTTFSPSSAVPELAQQTIEPPDTPNLRKRGFFDCKTLPAESGTIAVCWDPIDSGDPTVIMEYRYKQTSQDDPMFSEWTTIDDPPTDRQDQFFVRGLNNCISYDIQVRGRNSAGPGMADEITDYPKPDLTIRNIQLILGTREVAIYWEPIDYSGSNYRYEYELSVNGRDVTDDWTTPNPATSTQATERILTASSSNNRIDVDIRTVLLSCPENTFGAREDHRLRFGFNDWGGDVPEQPQNLQYTNTSADSITVSWDPIGDNGHSLTDTEYRFRKTGTSSFGNWQSTDSATATTQTISGLDPSSEYEIHIRGVNSEGDGPHSHTLTASILILPNQPTGLAVYPSHQSAVLLWDPIEDNGLAISSTQYRYKETIQTDEQYGMWADMDLTNPTLTSFSITGLTNSTSYDFQIRGKNDNGNGPATSAQTAIPISVPYQPQNLSGVIDNQAVVLSWDTVQTAGDPITATQFRYKRTDQPSSQWGDWTDTSQSSDTEVTVGSLTNFVSYDFQVRANNSAGDGPPAQLQLTPEPVPTQPQNLLAYPTNQAVILEWEVTNSNEHPITGTQYRQKESTQDESHWSAWNDIPNSANLISYRITGLSNNTGYDFQVRVGNFFGFSLASASSSATPIAVPDQPTHLQAFAQDQSVALFWDQITDHGSPLTGTQYRHKPVSSPSSAYTAWTDFTAPANPHATPYLLTGLTNDIIYDIQLRGVNASGSGPPATVTITTKPAPLAPEILLAYPTHQGVVLFWSPIQSDSSPILSTRYRFKETDQDTNQYSSWTTITGSPTPTSLTLPGLTNGTSYDFQVGAVNESGPGPYAAATATPAQLPDQPQDFQVYPIDGGLALLWDPIADNGEAITTTQYRYKASNQAVDQWGDWTPFTPPSNPKTTLYEVSGLTNNTGYDIQLRAVNANGNGPPALGTGTPKPTPSQPQNLVVRAAHQSAVLSWDPIGDNSAPLQATQYRYKQTDQTKDQYTDWTPIPGNATPTDFTVGGLTNATSYDIQLRGQNSMGEGPPATVTVIPLPLPSQPQNLTAYISHRSVVLNWDPIESNGDPLTNTEFRYKQTSQTKDQYMDWRPVPGMGTPTSFILSGLTNGISYDIQLRGRNSSGVGFEATVTATPEATPSQPFNLRASPTSQAVYISWDPITDNGFPITTTQYRFRQTGQSAYNSWTSFAPPADPQRTPWRIDGLTNGIEHQLQLRAQNSQGAGPSTTVIFTPDTLPALPEHLEAFPTNQSAVLFWAPIADNGDPVTSVQVRYKQASQQVNQYTTWTPVSGGVASTSHTIAGLTNGIPYDIQLRAENSTGAGPAKIVSATPNPTPGQPDRRRVDEQPRTGESGYVELDINPPIPDNGYPITATEYRFKLATQDPTHWSDWIEVDRETTTISFDSYRLTGSEGLEACVNYDFQFRAVNSQGAGAPLQVSGQTRPALAIFWEQLFLQNGNYTFYWENIDWRAPFTSLEYRIHELNVDGIATLVDWHSISPPDSTTLTYTSPISRNRFLFQTRFENACRNGNDAAAFYDITEVGNVPGQPQNLRALQSTPTSVSLTWNPIVDHGEALTQVQYRYRTSRWGDHTGIGDWITMDLPSPTATAFTIEGLQTEQDYQIQIRGVNSEGAGPHSFTLDTRTTVGPAAPSNIQIFPAHESLLLTWDPIADNGEEITATQYRFKPTSQGPESWSAWEVMSGDAAPTSYTVTGLTNGTRYDVQIRAVNAFGGGPTSTAPPTTPISVPDQPNPVEAFPSDQKVVIFWDPVDTQGSPITRIQYRYQETGPGATGGWTAWTTNANSGGADHTKLEISGLANGTHYNFQVRVANSRGNSPPAEVTASPTSTPPAPQSLEAFPTHRSAVLFWEVRESSASMVGSVYYRYKLASQGLDQYSSWTVVPSFRVPDTFTLTGLQNNLPYHIQIQSHNIYGGSPPATVTVTPASTPAQPVLSTDPVIGDQAVSFSISNISDNGDPITASQYRFKPTPSDETGWGSWQNFALTTGATTELLVTPLDNCVPYDFEIRATNSNGSGPPVRVSGIPAPDDITIEYLQYFPEEGGGTLYWDTIDDGGSPLTRLEYRVLSGVTELVPWTAIITRSTSQGLQGIPNEQINLQMRVANACKTGTTLSQDLPYPGPTGAVPGRPTNLVASEVASSSLSISWDSIVDNGNEITAISYRYKKETEAVWSDWTATASLNTNMETVDELDSQTVYQVQLRAENSLGWGPFSLTLQAVTSSPSSTTPTTPSTTNPTTPTTTTPTTPSMPSSPTTNQPVNSPTTNQPVVNQPVFNPPANNVPGPGQTNTPDATEPVSSTLTDIEGNTHAANITQLAERGITRGCNPPENTRFCPDRAVTRAEMATFLVRALDLAGTTNTPFADISVNVHRSNINALAEAGISRGCNPPNNDLFCPDRAVTRAEMATFLTRALALEAETTEFEDTVGNVHQTNINRLATAGITRGCNPPNNDLFCPDRAVTRAEMATFLTRALET